MAKRSKVSATLVACPFGLDPQRADFFFFFFMYLPLLQDMTYYDLLGVRGDATDIDLKVPPFSFASRLMHSLTRIH
jgi:hypothetical protein